MPYDKDGKYYRKPIYRDKKIIKLKKDEKEYKKNYFGFIAIISLIIFNLLSIFFIEPDLDKWSKEIEVLNKNEKVNKTSKKITSNSLDKPESKGLFDGMTMEDFLVIANNQIANEPANPDGYANRGLIYFHFKKYRSAFKDLNKSIKMSEYIDEELYLAYLARGLIYLKKSNMTGDIFEKKGCRDIKIAFELNKSEAMTLNEDEISAARKKCKI